MADKTYIPEGGAVPPSQIGATIEALAATIAARREAGAESYTHRLLEGCEDDLVKKVVEEANETALAVKDVECRMLVAQESAEALALGLGEGGNSVCAELPAEYDEAVDHLRYEAADVVYHLLVVLERYGIGLDEFAAELNTRMTKEERPQGGVMLFDDYVKRGK